MLAEIEPKDMEIRAYGAALLVLTGGSGPAKQPRTAPVWGASLGREPCEQAFIVGFSKIQPKGSCCQVTSPSEGFSFSFPVSAVLNPLDLEKQSMKQPILFPHYFNIIASYVSSINLFMLEKLEIIIVKKARQRKTNIA